MFLALVLRCMCGYEYISTIMLSAEIPVLYYLLRDWPDKDARRRWLRLGLQVGIVQLGAFAGSLLVWMVQLIEYEGIQMALETMKFTVIKRTGFSFLQTTIPLDAYMSSLSQPRTEVVKMYLSGEPLWGSCSVRSVLMAVFGVTAVNGWLAKQPWQKTLREIAFLGACALPPISWYFLASGHSAVHIHINYFLWGLPFLPLVTAFMVQRSAEVFVQIWKRKPPLRIGDAETQ